MKRIELAIILSSMACAMFCAGSCGSNGKDEPEPVKESLVFGTGALSVRTGASADLALGFSPEERASEIEVSVSDESVITIDERKVDGDTLRLVVTGGAVSSATIIAVLGDLSAECLVTVEAVEAESVSLSMDYKCCKVDESFILDAEILPENVTYMDQVTWTIADAGLLSCSPFDADAGDNVTSARFSALKEGETVITVSAGSCFAECRVVIESVQIPSSEPKIGDYYYSDGTWSDGGLVSINADGTEVEWQQVKPAPESGKTVIGIVFQTDTSRFSDREKSGGHTHGLVFSLKAAHSKTSSFTMYSVQEADDDINVMQKSKLALTCYNNVSGQDENDAVLAAFPGDSIQMCPAFDWVHTDFQPAAPANTSGWFIPSIGQLWDFCANLGGEEMAKYLLELRTGYAETNLYRIPDTTLSYNPLEKLNSVWALVPDEQKEDLVTWDKSTQVELVTSSLYDDEPSCCVMWFRTDGGFQPFMDWTNQSYLCHPILAF